MILADINWLPISITLLIIVHVFVSLLMILVVMMQRPKQEGLGAAFGAGMTDQLLGAGTTSFLQKATVWLGCLFFLISLILAILVGRQNQITGKIEEGTKVAPLEETAAPAIGEVPPVETEAAEPNLNILESVGIDVDEEEDAPASEEPAPAEEVSAPTDESPVLPDDAPAEETALPEGEEPIED
ncbi:MAG: preprotein translocase subunit SecG [Verrucomicrobiota bacterium JB023]|nr:preprotein translocase subunit SecG [Verrucomicrobiota bacterium JB023]